MPRIMDEMKALPGRSLLETAAQLLQEQTLCVREWPEEGSFEDYMWFVDHAPQYIYANSDYFVEYI